MQHAEKGLGQCCLFYVQETDASTEDGQREHELDEDELAERLHSQCGVQELSMCTVVASLCGSSG